MKATTVAIATGASKSVISQLKKIAEGENAIKKHAIHHGKIITAQEDGYISLVGKRVRNATPT